MESNLTGTPSGVICPLYEVVNQQSMQGKGGMAGGYSYRMKKEIKNEQEWSLGTIHEETASCEGPHEYPRTQRLPKAQGRS